MKKTNNMITVKNSDYRIECILKAEFGLFLCKNKSRNGKQNKKIYKKVNILYRNCLQVNKHMLECVYKLRNKI